MNASLLKRMTQLQARLRFDSGGQCCAGKITLLWLIPPGPLTPGLLNNVQLLPIFLQSYSSETCYRRMNVYVFMFRGGTLMNELHENKKQIYLDHQFLRDSSSPPGCRWCRARRSMLGPVSTETTSSGRTGRGRKNLSAHVGQRAEI